MLTFLGLLMKRAFSNVYVWIVLAGLALLVSIYAIGYVSARSDCKEAAQRARAEALQARLDRADADLIDAQLRIAALAAKSEEVRTVTQTVVKEIRVRVPDDRACDIGPDIIWMLDKARGAGGLPSAGGAHASGGPSSAPR